MREKKILNSLLVKPVGPDCDMSCRYCFYLDKGKLFENGDTVMADEVLESLIRQVVAGKNRLIRFVWQGGEPVLAGLRFFQKAVEYQDKYSIPGQQVENLFQTNGMGLNGAWTDFFRHNRFYVGLSLDGPEHIHNRYRRLKGGETSWKRVVAARDLLMSRGVPVSVVTVVNNISVRHPEDIYRFHQSSGIDTYRFVPVMNGGISAAGGEFVPGAEEYGEFLCRTFDLWLDELRRDGSPPFVEYFDSLLRIIAGEMPGSCTLLKSCGLYLTVERDGTVYPCDFYVDKDQCLGNVKEIPLVEMLNSEKQERFGNEKEALCETCLDCRWLSLCRGGCPGERRGTGSVSRFCRSYQTFLEHAFPLLSGMIEILPS